MTFVIGFLLHASSPGILPDNDKVLLAFCTLIGVVVTLFVNELSKLFHLKTDLKKQKAVTWYAKQLLAAESEFETTADIISSIHEAQFVISDIAERDKLDAADIQRISSIFKRLGVRANKPNHAIFADQDLYLNLDKKKLKNIESFTFGMKDAADKLDSLFQIVGDGKFKIAIGPENAEWELLKEGWPKFLDNLTKFEKALIEYQEEVRVKVKTNF